MDLLPSRLFSDLDTHFLSVFCIIAGTISLARVLPVIFSLGRLGNPLSFSFFPLVRPALDLRR